MRQAQYSEPSEGGAARVVAAGPRLLSVWQAQYSEPSEGVAARVVAAGPRLLSVWQAQRSEGLRRALSPLGRGFCLCGRRSIQSLQKGLRRALSPVWQAQYSEPSEGLRRALSPLGRGFCLCGRRRYSEPSEGVAARVVAAGSVCVAGAVLRASRKGVVARVPIQPAKILC